MNRSLAHGLAGGGVLLSMGSLLMPWYVLCVAGIDSGLDKSGAHALGLLALLVVVLAIAAGWSATAGIHRLVPPLAAAALTLVVLVKLLAPPAAASLLRPNGGDAIQIAFANAIAAGLHLHYAPAWGIWLAFLGAAAALAGTTAAALQDAVR